MTQNFVIVISEGNKIYKKLEYISNFTHRYCTLFGKNLSHALQHLIVILYSTDRIELTLLSNFYTYEIDTKHTAVAI